MPINVSEALDSDTAEIITVERTTAGGYVDGIYVEGATSTFKTLASCQPASAEDLQMLPEGERNKRIFVFISKKPIRVTEDREGELADTIIFKGRRYRVIQNADWSSYGHNTVYGALE